MRREIYLCKDPVHPDRPPWYCFVTMVADPYPSHSAQLRVTTPIGEIPASVLCDIQGGTISFANVPWYLAGRVPCVFIDEWSDAEMNALRLQQALMPVQALSIAEGLARVSDDLDALCSLAQMDGMGRCS